MLMILQNKRMMMMKKQKVQLLNENVHSVKMIKCHMLHCNCDQQMKDKLYFIHVLNANLKRQRILSIHICCTLMY